MPDSSPKSNSPSETETETETGTEAGAHADPEVGIEDKAHAALGFVTERLLGAIREAVAERERLSELVIEAEAKREIKTEDGQDISAAPAAVLNPASAQAEHLRQLEATVNLKLEKLRAADAAIDTKLDKLTRFETSMQKLMAGFQSRIEDMARARELGTAMQTEFAERMQAAAASADETIARIDRRVQAGLSKITDQEHRLTDRAAHLEQKLESLAATADEALSERLDRAESQIAQRLDRTHVEIAERVDQADAALADKLEKTLARVNGVGEEIDAKREAFDAHLGHLQGHIHKSIANAQATMGERSGRVRAEIDTLEKSATDRLEAAQARAAKTVAAAEVSLGERAASIESSLGEKKKELDQQIAEALADHANEIEAARREVVDRENETRAFVSALHESFDRAAEETAERADRYAKDASATVSGKLHGALHGASESIEKMLADFEGELREKTVMIGASAAHSIDQTDASLREKITRLREDATSMIAMVESRLTRRMKKLDPETDAFYTRLSGKLDALAERCRTTQAEAEGMTERVADLAGGAEETVRTLHEAQAAIDDRINLSRKMVSDLASLEPPEYILGVPDPDTDTTRRRQLDGLAHRLSDQIKTISDIDQTRKPEDAA